MDRAAKLAELTIIAERHLRAEERSPNPDLAREITRDCLAAEAEQLGFSSLEISAAVDQALTDAGTTP